MLRRFLILMALAATLAGCQNNAAPEITPGKGDGSPRPAVTPTSEVTHANPPPAMNTNIPPGMKQDPRSVREVQGTITELTDTHLFVAKPNTPALKFLLKPESKVKPEGTKLAKDLKVKISIEHVEDGMVAKEIEVVK